MPLPMVCPASHLAGLSGRGGSTEWLLFLTRRNGLFVMNRICKTGVTEPARISMSSPKGTYVPVFDSARLLSVECALAPL
jgi:hypothetical protein